MMWNLKWTHMAQLLGPIPKRNFYLKNFLCFPKKLNFTNEKNFHTYLKEQITWLTHLLKKIDLRRPTPTKVFSCGCCGIFKNSFFIEHLRWLPLYFDSNISAFFMLDDNIKKKQLLMGFWHLFSTITTLFLI